MIYLIIVGLVFLVDYSIKRNVEKTYVQGQEEELFDGKIVMRRASNAGVAGGLFADKPDWVTNASIFAIAAIAIRFFVLLFQKGRRGLKIAYSMILGGGISNLIDRFRQGYVTDYISINKGPKQVKNLVFNVADVFILIGCTFLVIFGFKKKKKVKKES